MSESHTKRPRRTIWNEVVEGKLRVQVRIFLVIFLVTVAIAIERIITNGVNPLWAVPGFAIGIVIGAVIARTRPLHWDHPKREVTSTNSVLGIIVIVLYLLFVFNRSDIISRWIDSGDVVGVVAITITSGVMLGRVWVTFRGVRGVLRAAKLAHDQEPADG